MCGICGLVLREKTSKAEIGNGLSAMFDAISHRGPDDYATHVTEKFGLGTNRLQIVGAPGVSPVHYARDGKLIAVFNGEIVNFKQLARDYDIDLNGRSDGAVILPLYQRYGAEFVSKLAGMFSIAIYDVDANALQLWRDPQGVKPLYFCNIGRSFYFSSELKAIKRVVGSELSLDVSALRNIIQYRFHPGRTTIYKEIDRVLPGETIRYRDGFIDRRFYWTGAPNVESTASSLADLEAEFDELFNSVVQQNCIADVPGGFFVSGGLDSSGIFGMALNKKERYRTPISLQFGQHSTSDSQYGKELERELGSPFQWVNVTDQGAIETLQKAVLFQDEPIENPTHVCTYLMAKRASEMGIKTILTGDGADEFFYGYSRFSPFFKGRVDEPGARYSAQLVSGHDERALTSLFLPEVYEQCHAPRDIDGDLIEQFRSFDDVRRFEQRNRLPEYHCMRLDRMTMAWGVEAKVPFLDRRVAEFAQRIPATTHYGRDGKDFLRSVLRKYIPNAIIKRPKQFFPSLPDQWLRGKGNVWAKNLLLDPGAVVSTLFKRDELERLLNEHGSETGNHGRLLWSISVIELWLKNQSLHKSDTSSRSKDTARVLEHS